MHGQSWITVEKLDIYQVCLSVYYASTKLNNFHGIDKTRYRPGMSVSVLKLISKTIRWILVYF